MRFKIIFLIFALVPLINAGVVLSGDDDNELKEYFDPLLCIYSDHIIE